MRTMLLALALIAPLLSGCLSDDDPTGGDEAPVVASSAEEAGAVAGESPVAPKSAFKVVAAEGEAGDNQKEAVAYPLHLRTNAAKPPETIEIDGVFNATDCMGFGLTNGVAQSWRNYDLRDKLHPGDVFAYDLHLTYETTASSWAEIHMVHGLGNTVVGHNEPNGDKRGLIDENFTGQSYRISKDDMAWVSVNCWYGQTTQPIPFKLTLTLTFAENAVPAETPILVPVPAGATKLFVRGVPLDPDEGVNSHFRIFGPDDSLLCECGLGALSEASYFQLPGPGEYVILVDHTSNGFVSLALDVPPEGDLKALAAEWVPYKVLSANGESVDKTVELNLPKVPLVMHGFSTAGGDGPSAGGGKGVQLEVTNKRGTPLAIKWGGYVAHQVRSPAANWNQWWGVWPDPNTWGYSADHHAYTPGLHSVHVKADALKGDVYVLTRQYIRA